MLHRFYPFILRVLARCAWHFAIKFKVHPCLLIASKGCLESIGDDDCAVLVGIMTIVSPQVGAISDGAKNVPNVIIHKLVSRCVLFSQYGPCRGGSKRDVCLKLRLIQSQYKIPTPTTEQRGQQIETQHQQFNQKSIFPAAASQNCSCGGAARSRPSSLSTNLFLLVRILVSTTTPHSQSVSINSSKGTRSCTHSSDRAKLNRRHQKSQLQDESITNPMFHMKRCGDPRTRSPVGSTFGCGFECTINELRSRTELMASSFDRGLT